MYRIAGIVAIKSITPTTPVARRLTVEKVIPCLIAMRGIGPLWPETDHHKASAASETAIWERLYSWLTDSRPPRL